MVNRGIVQNLHYFAAAFAAYLSDPVRVEIDMMRYPDSTLSADCEQCLSTILKQYQQYLKTKDREMMHYVLFTFKNFHESIFRNDLWSRLSDDTRILYLDILQTVMTSIRPTVQNSWRYYLTFLKVVMTIIDSNYHVNEEYAAESAKGDKGVLVRKSQ